MENKNAIKLHGNDALILKLFAHADWLSPVQVAKRLKDHDYFAVNGVKEELNWLVREGLLRVVDFEGSKQVYGLTADGTLALSALNVINSVIAAAD